MTKDVPSGQLLCESKAALKIVYSNYMLRSDLQLSIIITTVTPPPKKKKAANGHQKIFGGVGHGDDFTGVCLCPNSSNCIH